MYSIHENGYIYHICLSHSGLRYCNALNIADGLCSLRGIAGLPGDLLYIGVF